MPALQEAHGQRLCADGGPPWEVSAVTHCLGGMFATPLGFVLRVGVLFLSSGVQVAGSKPSSPRSSTLSRITLVVFSRNPTEPPKRSREVPCSLSQSPPPRTRGGK